VKALVLDGFGAMSVHERQKPVAGPDELVVEIVATGICGSDIHGFTGENGRRVPGQVMGHETVGVVAECGSETGRFGFTVGDVVTFNPVVIPAEQSVEFAGREQHCPDKYVIGVAHHVVAAFAQFVAVPARNIVALDAGMPIEYGALIEPIAVGWLGKYGRREPARALLTAAIMRSEPMAMMRWAAAKGMGCSPNWSEA